MADALLSPAVGGGFWIGTVAFISHATRKLRKQFDDRLIPLMGVLGAFVFAAQMINFTIPGTGSSGHIGGGMLLAIILGPHASFIVIASVLTVQALFFADGGLLSLGSNIWNLGLYPCYLAYPLIYRSIVRSTPSTKRITAGAIVSSVFALQLGAFSVVIQTKFSGIAELSFISFLLLMQPVHLIIGIIEGVITAAVVNYLKALNLDVYSMNEDFRKQRLPKITIIVIAVFALLTGGVFSWFASKNPDGLEWSIKKLYGSHELPERDHTLSKAAAELQDKTALFPDYQKRESESDRGHAVTDQWTQPDSVKSLSGLLGSIMVFSILVFAGAGIRYMGRKRRKQ